MISTVLPALYFFTLFGFFEAVLFPRRIDYWHRPITVALYFCSGTLGALLLFSLEPLLLIESITVSQTIGLVFLAILLGMAVLSKWFAYTEGGQGSAGYIIAKTTDLIFQDTVAIIIALSLTDSFGAVVGTLSFALYFFAAHLLLLLVLPVRYAALFITGAFFGGIAFGTIVSTGVGVVYIFILHWLFYLMFFPTIRTVLKREYAR